jgi:putative membrane protein
MVDSPAELGQHRFQVKTTADSHFAWIRTRLSLERTMMSWVRTAIALIGFGFTIVQFFDRFSQFSGVEQAERPLAPFYFGLLLIGAGVAALVVSGWQYRAVIRYLRQGDFEVIAGVNGAPTHTPVYAITIIMIFIGVFAFLAVVTRAL